MNHLAAIVGLAVVGFIIWFVVGFILFAVGIRDARIVWPVVGAGWLLAAWYLRRRYQDVQFANTPDGICPHCGYDLRATPDRCPECGHTSKR